jgi:hypothetical protein
VHRFLIARELLLELPELMRGQYRQMMLHDLAGARPRGAALFACLELERKTFLQIASGHAGRLQRLHEANGGA